ncbi:unnamed protein product [Mycena citricolor]|uniref:Uncharacterized protein n=1 Tax=Mycena citricolor TaxID=2018698 RepID=A0AAD2HSI0_9AGAR|nr:unnamed protein product [Mycena citricolor]
MHLPSESSEDRNAVLHIVRDLRGDAIGALDHPLASSSDYPDVVLEVAANLSHGRPSSDYLILWELILQHWFPQDQGYQIQHEWKLPHSSSCSTLAVFDQHSNTPVLLLQLCALEDFDDIQTRATAEAFSEEDFHHVAQYCSSGPLCALTAMGQRWMAFQRFDALTGREAPQLSGERRVQWMDDAISELSYDLLRSLLVDLKEGVRVLRLNH